MQITPASPLQTTSSYLSKSASPFSSFCLQFIASMASVSKSREVGGLVPFAPMTATPVRPTFGIPSRVPGVCVLSAVNRSVTGCLSTSGKRLAWWEDPLGRAFTADAPIWFDLIRFEPVLSTVTGGETWTTTSGRTVNDRWRLVTGLGHLNWGL